MNAMINLDAGEQILLEARRHWYIFFIEVAGVALGACAPFVLVPMLGYFDGAIFDMFAAQVAFFSFTWFLIFWNVFFVVWTNYYLDVLVVTNRRVIDYEQHSLFRHDMAEVRIERIQDIKVEVFGILPSLLDFGNIQVQTSGASEEFIIRNIPSPHKVKDLISQLQAPQGRV